MNAKQYIEKIISRSFLTQEESKNCMLLIGNGEMNDAQIVALMTGLQFRGLELNELKGFSSALLELAIPVHLDFEHAIDVCGTGGDGKNTFNISTTTAFVLASMGHKVVKHGNYGVSSLCGSSNVLEHLGIRFSSESRMLQQQLDKSNICFLHAPLFHPALKVVAPLRKQLGISTFFNGLGPLVNPARPTHQLVGTYSLELAKLYQHVLQNERKNFTVIHGLDGYDELTFIGSTRLLGKTRDTLIPSENKKYNYGLEALSGGKTVSESAKILVDLLHGKGTIAQNHVLAGNVALGIQTFLPEETFENAYNEAQAFLKSGSAITSFKQQLA